MFDRFFFVTGAVLFAALARLLPADRPAWLYLLAICLAGLALPVIVGPTPPAEAKPPKRSRPEASSEPEQIRCSRPER